MFGVARAEGGAGRGDEDGGGGMAMRWPGKYGFSWSVPSLAPV